MSQLAAVTGVLMVFCTGLWTGGILIIALDRTHVWSLMSIHEYAVDFRRSVRRLDPMMPILGLVGFLGAVGFALQPRGDAARLLAWGGAGLVLVAIVASIVVAEPINSRFRKLPEGTPPPTVADDRVRWGRFHRARAVVAVVAFAVLTVALAV